MKKILFVCLMMIFAAGVLFAQASAGPKTKLILLIAEQNIGGPQTCWWASEIDLSVTESVVAQKLLSQGYEVLQPSVLDKTISQNPAFKMSYLTEQSVSKLGKLSAADYVISGKALATSGGNVPQSRMVSCFANITAKVIRVADGKVIAYLDASGNSAHLDAITGGKEALRSAGEDLSAKIIEALTKEGGK
jgi:hypothetical protein